MRQTEISANFNRRIKFLFNHLSLIGKRNEEIISITDDITYNILDTKGNKALLKIDDFVSLAKYQHEDNWIRVEMNKIYSKILECYNLGIESGVEFKLSESQQKILDDIISNGTIAELMFEEDENGNCKFINPTILVINENKARAECNVAQMTEYYNRIYAAADQIVKIDPTNPRYKRYIDAIKK